VYLGNFRIRVVIGRAKTMASLWQNRQEEPKQRAAAFKLDVEESSNAGVYENDPTTLQQGVVRSTDQVSIYTIVNKVV